MIQIKSVNKKYYFFYKKKPLDRNPEVASEKISLGMIPLLR